MSKLRYCIGAICLAICFPIMAQKYIIKGKVYSQKNHTPLSNVFIQIMDKNKSSDWTDKDGSFQIKTNHTEGKLWCSLMGYKALIVHYNVLEGNHLSIQLKSNTQIFTKVTIAAFGNEKSIKNTSGSVAVLSAKQLKLGNGTSIQQALNRVPGVRMDQSSLNDSRISIRGNGVRSPWGMRNVKVYVNGIPLTEVDGTTRMEAIDVPALGSAEIIKGPGSSIYGASLGGVIKLHLAHSPYQEQSLETSIMVGAYGLNREEITYRGGGDKMNSYISYGHQYYDGYRKHSTDQRDFFTANFLFYPSDRQELTLLISRTSQKTQIPGELTKNQVENNRRQATDLNIKKNTGRIQNWTRIGIGQRYRFNKCLTNKTSLYTYFYDLHHPLIFGIIRNFYQSYGGRTLFEIDPHIKILPTVFTIGGEFGQSRTKGSIYANNNGVEGNMFSNNQYKNTGYTGFIQMETQFWNVVHLQLGVSYSGLIYNVTDFLHPKRGGIKQFKPQASPRIALSHDFGDWLSLHASVSSGFANPTTTQIQNADQSINKSIQAVNGLNFEIDAKGNFLDSRLNYSLSLYDMRMKGELIAQTILPGVTVYHNSGKTDHKGIELALSYAFFNRGDDHEFIQLSPYFSLTYSDFKITDYKTLDVNNNIISNYDGNRLVGVAPWVVSSGVVFDTKTGFYGNVNYFYSDKYALNDENTDFNAAYSLLNAKLGYKIVLWKHLEINVFAGLKNILDEKYSSFTALNASTQFGNPAYFNPSPGRNWYGGIKLKYSFQ